jgi:ribonuclease VapC
VQALRCVLDASALLAFLYKEPGADQVLPLIPTAYMSAVNQSEVLQKNAARGMSKGGLFESLQASGLTIVSFDGQAELTAALWPQTKAFGLSFADRACLALAKTLSLPAYTADKEWLRAGKTIGVEVRLIR